MLDQIVEYIKLLTDSNQIISQGGLVLITLIVFAETGLFFCFFLPGDYLLFSAGLLCGTGSLSVSIFLLVGCILGASIGGNYTGFYIGRFLGGRLYRIKDSWYFKRKYLDSTHVFFEKYGGVALVIGRFLPVVRTFAPLLAGMSEMRKRVFSFYTIIGGILWVGLLCLSGYFLGRKYPEIVHHIGWIILAFVAFTSLTLLQSYLKIRKENKKPKLDV